MTITKVLIDGGARLNIIFFRNAKEDGTTTRRDDHTNKHTFLWHSTQQGSNALGQITLPVTFGTPSNYRIEFIKFEVEDFESSYHAILGRPALTKFMAIPHYPYLLLKMPGPNGVLSLRSDLKRAFDYDVQAIQIAAKAQATNGRKEIAAIVAELSPEELETPAKKPSILAPPKEADVKQIDLGTGDPAKTATISAHLSAK